MHPPDLFGTLLASVSRSFYLTLRVLPRGVRKPIGLAYLLARASDTMADSARIDVHERLTQLRAFGAAIAGHGIAPGQSAIGKLASGLDDPAEATLLGQIPLLLALLEKMPPPDRAEIIRVLTVIIEGQELDLLRFEKDRGKDEIRTLETEADLDDYTYRVAGCVGEFWTRLCLLHLPEGTRKNEADMIRHGIAFGKGLQLVNILRDTPSDLAQGRCYLPLETLSAHGLSPETLLSRPEAARPVFDTWMARAREHLEHGYRYIEATRPWRLRLACFLPWALGCRTLDLLIEHPPLESATRVKVPRSEVYGLLLRGIRAAVSQPSLRHYRASLPR